MLGGTIHALICPDCMTFVEPICRVPRKPRRLEVALMEQIYDRLASCPQRECVFAATVVSTAIRLLTRTRR